MRAGRDLVDPSEARCIAVSECRVMRGEKMPSGVRPVYSKMRSINPRSALNRAAAGWMLTVLSKGKARMSGVRIQNVYQVTSGMEAALRFYRDMLGMHVKFQDGEKWCQLDAGGGNFALSAPAEAAPGATGTVVVLEVDDLEARRAAIEADGVQVDDVRDMGDHGRVLTCRDPDGTIVQLFQRT